MTRMLVWLRDFLAGWPGGAVLAPLAVMLVILLLSAALYWLLARVGVRLLVALSKRTRQQFDNALARRGFYRRLAAMPPAMLALALSREWLDQSGTAAHLMTVAAHLWLLVAGLATVFALLDALIEIYDARPYARQMPLQGFMQGVKLVLIVIAGVLGIALLMGKSPTLLVSGLGAMTAVLMLIFKDPILGFVAGIQLAANRMLAVGDWLEMPKYNADGDVIEITLTTVKVRNWDNTISTIPTYALISDSFKNWRGMQEAGGRRIKRSIFIDMQSVRFLTPDDIERLRKAQLLTQYIDRKLEEIARSNREQGVDPSSPVNGRRLTNIGTFRAYLLAYIQHHPGIHKEMLAMVRQLQPTAEGLPLEIYAFSHDTLWTVYEGVQADIFDHILAVAPEFGLRVFQTPAGSDLRALRAPDAPGSACGKD